MIRGTRLALLALLVVLLVAATAQSSVALVGHAGHATQTDDVERAHERLQQANRSYQQALAAVEAAREAGADTGTLDNRLDDAYRALNTGIAAVQATPPQTARALDAAERAERLSRAVRTDAVAAGRNARAETAIDRQSARLTAPEASTWLAQARRDRQEGRFDAVERDLLYAQYATQLAHYDVYLTNLSGQGLTLRALDAEVTTFRARLNDGQVASTDARRLRQSVTAADTCLWRLRAATLAIEEANRTSSVLAPADVTAATAARQQGYDALERGDYAVACRRADAATRLADAETSRVERALDGDVVARVVDVVYDVVRSVVSGFGDPPSPAAVTPPALTFVEVVPVEVTFVPPTPTVTPLDFSADTVSVPPPPTDRAPTAPDGSDDQRPDTGDETARDTDAADRGGGDDEGNRKTGDGEADGQTVEFTLRIDSVEECGTTCREVTGTLRNVGTADAHNVVVDVELSTDGTVIWTGTESLGTVAAGESRTVPLTVQLSFGDALRARSNGSVDAVITVQSDERTQTFRETIPV